MYRLVTALMLLCLSGWLHADNTKVYRVDVIVFEHVKLLEDANEKSLIPAILLPSKSSIPLALGDFSNQKLFRNVPVNQSELKNTYQALKRNPDYQVLARYTWLQPIDSKRAVDLPPTETNKWRMMGRIQLVPARFPMLKTNILLSKDNETIPVRHLQALKEKQTYYIDHPRFGILVRLTPEELSLPETAQTESSTAES